VTALSTKIGDKSVSFPFQHQIGVGVVLVDSVDIKKVLVGKRKNCAGAGMLSLPGGHLEKNESVYDWQSESSKRNAECRQNWSATCTHLRGCASKTL